MNNMLFPDDVDNVIQFFYLINEDDEATQNVVLAIGAQMLDISEEEMLERIK